MKKQNIKILFMFVLLVLTFFLSVCIGRYAISPVEVIKSIVQFFIPSAEGVDELKYNVIMQVRMPRIILSMIVGAGFGASLAILLSAGAVGIQSQALFFGLLAVAIVLLISKVRKKTQIYMLVLSGVIVSALFEALISMIKYVANPQDELPAITVWLMGSLASASYKDVIIAALTIIPCMAILFALRWKMNLLSLNEDEARSLGIKVEQMRLIIIVVSTLMTAVSVSLCGVIGWIGLVIPHVARFLVGNDHRGLVPACILLGATYLLIIDGIARTLSAAELPISILTAIIGAPFFAIMLRKTATQ